MTPILDTALIKHHRVDYAAIPPRRLRISRRAVGLLVVCLAFGLVSAGIV